MARRWARPSPSPRRRRAGGRRSSGRGRTAREHVGERGEVLDDGRRELFEQGHELPADADAGEAGVEVRGIRGEGEAVALEVGEDVAAARAEQGTHEIGGGARGSPRLGTEIAIGDCIGKARDGSRGARREDGEAPRARSTEEAEEEGLGPVVRGVAEGDHPRPGGLGGARERLVASGPGARLEVRPRRHADTRHRERHAERPGHAARRGRARRRLRRAGRGRPRARPACGRGARAGGRARAGARWSRPRPSRRRARDRRARRGARRGRGAPRGARARAGASAPLTGARRPCRT